jgi:hypothetical protein
MTEAERLRVQAERSLRLAKGAEGSAIGAAMRDLAAEFLERARVLENGPSDDPATAPTAQ